MRMLRALVAAGEAGSVGRGGHHGEPRAFSWRNHREEAELAFMIDRFYSQHLC